MSRLAHSHQPSMDAIEANARAEDKRPRASARREFANEVGNHIEIEVVIGEPGCLCRLSMFGPHTSVDNYTTRMELEQLRDAINEALPPAASHPCPRCGEMRDVDRPDGCEDWYCPLPSEMKP